MKRSYGSLVLALCLAAVAVGVAAGSPLNRKISGDMPGYADLHPYQDVTISPDSRYAVYASDARIDEFYEVYSVRLDGSSPPVRLSGPAQRPINLTTLDWKITPDSRRVLYRARESELGDVQLFSVPIEGGQKVRLSPAGQKYDYAYNYVISPNGSHVVLSNEDAIFSVPVEGGEAVQLPFDRFSQFQITADSATVVYGQDALYSVPIGGGVVISMSNELQPIRDWQLYEGGAGVQHVAFIAANDAGLYDLYTAPVTGGDIKKVLSALNGTNARFSICSDGGSVVLQTGDDAGKQTLYSVSLTARSPIMLATEVGMPGSGGTSFAVSPDCSSVVYGSGESLFVAHVTGGDPTRISYLCYQMYTFSPDSRYMAYWGKERLEQPCELRALDLATKASRRINAPLAAGGRVMVGVSLITPDSQSVLYVAEQESGNVAELFMASFDGAQNKKLSGPMTFGGNVTRSPVLSPDGRYVVYRADQERDEVHELYSTALEGDGGAQSYLPLVQR